MRIPVLTYHSNNISGNAYAQNDHIALASDLQAIHRLGLRIVSLARVVDVLLGEAPETDVEGAVALSFDDGSWFDWHDLDHPTCGPQRSFAGILRDFTADTGAAAHATSFVIVSPDARATLDRTCLIGAGWWGDDWWREASREGLLSIESHSWDHNHHTLPHTVQRDQVKGTFRSIDTEADADAEIRQAADALDRLLAPTTSRLLAYPYGETNDYLVEDYLPRHIAAHRLRAAFDTTPRPVEADTHRWRMPRFVCGRDWRSPEDFSDLLEQAT